MKISKSLGNYNVTHNLGVPSRLSDYDYDPSHPARRFLSTYIHEVTFSDPITGADLSSVVFGSLTCAELISGLYEITYSPSPMAKAITIEDVFPYKESSSTGIIILTRSNGITKLSICDFVTPTVTFDIYRIDELIELLSVDEVDDLFIDNSMYRW